MRVYSVSPTWSTRLPCRSTGTASGNCRETETCMVPACHTPRQPPLNHSSGHHAGWATPRSADEMQHRQHQRVDILVHARTAHKDLLQKRLEEDLCRIVHRVPPTTQSVKGLNCTELMRVRETAKTDRMQPVTDCCFIRTTADLSRLCVSKSL